MIRTRYAVPNFFTSLNFLMGTFAVVIAPLGTQQIPFFGSHKTALEWASWLIVYSVLLDKLDGFFAKRLSRLPVHSPKSHSNSPRSMSGRSRSAVAIGAAVSRARSRGET